MSFTNNSFESYPSELRVAMEAKTVRLNPGQRLVVDVNDMTSNAVNELQARLKQQSDVIESQRLAIVANGKEIAKRRNEADQSARIANIYQKSNEGLIDRQTEKNRQIVRLQKENQDLIQRLNAVPQPPKYKYALARNSDGRWDVFRFTGDDTVGGLAVGSYLDETAARSYITIMNGFQK